MKVKTRVDYEWIVGHVRYGHREGVLELSDEDYEEFKENPGLFLKETGAEYDLDLIIDDFSIDDYGDFEVNYEEVIDGE